MAQTGKKINELAQISTVTDETVLPGVYVNSSIADSTASKISVRQLSDKVQNDMSGTLAGKQDTLVSSSNIKTINGESILGSGDLAISTYQEFNNSWTTNSTFAEFLTDVYNDIDAVPGMAYLGGLTCSGLPTGLNNVEAVVEIIAGSANDSKVIHIVITSGTTSPYRWEYTYWYLNNSFHNSGWISFQPSLPSGTTGYYLQKTASGVQWAEVQAAGGVPTLTWYADNTGTTLNTGLDLSNANLVKVYKNGVLLRPGDPIQYDTRYYPTSNDSRASITLTNFIDFNSASSWKIEGVAKKTSTRNDWRLISNGLYDCTTPLLGGTGSNWLLALSSNGTSWDMYINNPGVLPDLTSEFNFDIGFTGTQYYADFNGTPFFSLNSTTKIYANSTRSRLALLNTAWDPSLAFPGYIVMNKFKVTVDNVVAFDGANANEVTDFTISYCTKEVVQVGGGGNDYNVSGGTINFTTALEVTDKIAVEVF